MPGIFRVSTGFRQSVRDHFQVAKRPTAGSQGRKYSQEWVAKCMARLNNTAEGFKIIPKDQLRF
jgi:hypothetical protein